MLHLPVISRVGKLLGPDLIPATAAKVLMPRNVSSDRSPSSRCPLVVTANVAHYAATGTLASSASCVTTRQVTLAICELVWGISHLNFFTIPFRVGCDSEVDAMLCERISSFAQFMWCVEVKIPLLSIVLLESSIPDGGWTEERQERKKVNSFLEQLRRTEYAPSI